ncbi:LolA family protein [Streptomyces thermodiastaticus]|uniref:LolA family protein n=1 Tax=Streptomyces thermodiastaticus TaxID=44061 RepID=UPI00167670B0|nr:DUF2092 domain-containing protein [Streptomyces thermodiastaticus]MCE7552461.1 DUF2092 domain-containing protein [Streptomyces thermodiastaticus]GHF85179.1 hypothetical protein GCM10018787_37480 [Streptomyces thermodiastaticus]
MAPYASDGTTDSGQTRVPHPMRRKAARYVVPVAVMGVAAATIGLVPALADSGDPDLPDVSARQLLAKIAASDVEQLSGTVRISTDLGLPDLGGLADGPAFGVGKDGDGSSADPASRLAELASGTHTLRVAADGPDRQKVSLVEKAAEYSIVHNGKDVWGYDSASGEVYHTTASQHGEQHREQVPGTPQDFAGKVLAAVDDTTSVTVDGTARVAGRDAYRLVVTPRHASGTTVGVITIAVDSATGLPLKFTLTPAGGGPAVVDAGFTRISFAEPAASTFRFTPPKGAKVTEGEDAGEHSLSSGALPEGLLPSGKSAGDGAAKDGVRVIGKGWNSVVRFDTGLGGGTRPSSGQGAASGFLGSLGDQVSGKFGTGTVFSTRLVNALITDDGTVYAGAVTKDTLVKAASGAR